MTRWLALLPLALSAAPALAQQDEPKPDQATVDAKLAAMGGAK